MGKTQEIIDADELVGDEIPADLARKVSMWHPYLAECQIQVQRVQNEGWSILRNRIKFGQQPPPMEVDKICLKICEIAEGHASGEEPAFAYRARLGVKREGIGQIQWKFANLRTVVGADGSLRLVDFNPEDNAQDGGVGRMDEFTDLAIRSLGAVVEAAEGYSGIGIMVKNVLGEAVTLVQSAHMQRGADAEVELARDEVRLRADMAQQEHEQSLAKIARIGDFLDELAGPIGESLRDVFSEFWGEGEDPSSSASEPDRGGRGPMAAKMNRWYTGLDEKQQAAFQGIFVGQDEWELITKAMAASSDAEFANLFKTMSKSLDARKYGIEQFRKDLVKTTGVKNARRLGQILKKLERFQ